MKTFFVKTFLCLSILAIASVFLVLPVWASGSDCDGYDNTQANNIPSSQDFDENTDRSWNSRYNYYGSQDYTYRDWQNDVENRAKDYYNWNRDAGFDRYKTFKNSRNVFEENYYSDSYYGDLDSAARKYYERKMTSGEWNYEQYDGDRYERFYGLNDYRRDPRY